MAIAHQETHSLFNLSKNISSQGKISIVVKGEEDELEDEEEPTPSEGISQSSRISESQGKKAKRSKSKAKNTSHINSNETPSKDDRYWTDQLLSEIVESLTFVTVGIHAAKCSLHLLSTTQLSKQVRALMPRQF